MIITCPTLSSPTSASMAPVSSRSSSARLKRICTSSLGRFPTICFREKSYSAFSVTISFFMFVFSSNIFMHIYLFYFCYLCRRNYAMLACYPIQLVLRNSILLNFVETSLIYSLEQKN